jgi:hypothetical protein
VEIHPSARKHGVADEDIRHVDPELRDQLLERATADGTTISEVIRRALRRFLEAA